jgi:hypothetical protein
MVAAGRLVGLARAGAASQAGSDCGRTDEQEEIPPLDRHPDTLPRVGRAPADLAQAQRRWPSGLIDGRRGSN